MTSIWRCFLFTTAMLTLAATSGPLRAEPFWKKLVPSKPIKVDEEADFRLTDECGPWLIMATTFSGEGAESQARDLVIELHRRYKLKAYLHEMTFDFTDDVQGRGVDASGRPKRMRYRRGNKLREIAVLVGDFSSVDEPAVEKTLNKIKYMKPHTLDPAERGQTNQTLAALRTIQQALLPAGDRRKERGPMGKAFVTRNPLIPKEYFAPPGVDEFVEKINSDVKYSLLRNKGKYTVKVATFTGNVVLDQNKIRQLENGATMKSRLAEAGEKAEKLTFALREKGYDAYVFHDRHASMVTVGAFDSTGIPRRDGKIEINPQIHNIMQRFGATPVQAGPTQANSPQPQSAFKPKSIVDIPLDIQPQIVHVPRPQGAFRR